MPATIEELEFQVANETEKLARLKSGELKAEEVKGDGRQETAIHRCEGRIRQLQSDIADRQPKVKEGK